jgi:molecular chaperone DnaK
LTELKKELALPEKDLAKIDTATEALNTAWNAASEDIYKASQEAANATAGAQPNNGAEHTEHTEQKPGDTVSDVEYEEVKDNK